MPPHKAPHSAHSHDHDHSGPGHSHDHSGHGHGLFHSHAHGDHNHGQNASERRLWWSLTVLAVFTALEAIGGFWSHSIALLAQAVHMLADCGSLILSVLGNLVSPRA